MRIFAPFYLLFDLVCGYVDRALNLDFGDDDE